MSIDSIKNQALLLRGLAAERIRAITKWQAIFLFAMFLYIRYFTAISLDVHHGLGTSAYDFGLYDQGVWLMSQFHAPFVTLMGRNLFGDHSSLIMFFVVPFYWIWPSAGVLFFIQSLVIALGSVPIFLFARKHLSEPTAVVVALMYFLHPAVGYTNRENFHPDSFLAFFVGMALYAALDRKWRMYGLFVVLTFLVKEDVLLVLVPLGVWVALNRDRRIGLLSIAGSIGATLVGMFVIMKSLNGTATRNLWRIPFGGPWGFVKEILERPGNVVKHFGSDSRPYYIWQMLFPSGFVFLKRPTVLLISALVLFTNTLSTFSYQYSIRYHYSLVAVPAILMGSVYAISFTTKHRRAVVSIFVSASIWSCFMWGVVPIGRFIQPFAKDPVGREIAGYWPREQPQAVAARAIIKVIPPDANVSAYYSLTAHLTHREKIFMFPNPFRVVLYGKNLDAENARACQIDSNKINYIVLKKVLDEDQIKDWKLIAQDFTQVATNEYWTVFKRTSQSVTCMKKTNGTFPTLVTRGPGEK